MELKAKEPKVRFGEFTREWEQLSLKDGLVKNSKKNKGLSINNVESVSNKTGFTKQTEQFDDYSVASADLSNYYVIAEKQFAYNPSRINVGSIAYKSEGDETSVVSPLYVSFFTNEILDDKFLWYWFKTSAFEKQRQRLSEGGVRDTLSFNQLSQMSLLISQLEEQKQVGKLLATIDHSLKLHQQELEQLKESKKTLLSKMFPKEGVDRPEIRFAGFTDPWEERLVGDFLTESRIEGTDGLKARKLTVKLWSKGVIPKSEVYQGSEATHYFVRKAGQFIYGKLDFLNQAFGIVPPELDGYESTLDSPAFDFSGNLNPTFFLEYVSRKSFYQYQGNIANGSRKAKRIHSDTFLAMPLVLPRKVEQEKIGSFFKQLDDTITLHQQELENLKELKKTLLNLMFV